MGGRSHPCSCLLGFSALGPQNMASCEMGDGGDGVAGEPAGAATSLRGLLSPRDGRWAGGLALQGTYHALGARH